MEHSQNFDAAPRPDRSVPTSTGATPLRNPRLRQVSTRTRAPAPRPIHLQTQCVIDPELDPPDPRLVAAFGPSRCARLRVLPWRKSGVHTIVLYDEFSSPSRHSATLESVLGPIRFARCDQRTFCRALIETAGTELVGQAEASLPIEQSCRGNLVDRVARSIAAMTVVAIALILTMPGIFVAMLFATAFLGMALNAVPKIAALWIHFLNRPAPRTTANAHQIRLPLISIFVPLFREADIATNLLSRLGKLDYPSERLDICLILEEEDWTTRATISRTKLPNNVQVITVPKGQVQTKPRAMNFALNFARGTIVGIYDAEDAPEPDQLRKVAQRFAERGPQVACLQGSLDYYNTETNWLSRCFTLEYAGWFRLILPALQRLGMTIPLGGTTLFLRRDAIEKIGGWDAFNVTEDADLGVRLHRFGYRTELIETTTFEEANASAWPWVRQRSRWLKGYALTYAVHMSKPALLWRDIGCWGFLGVQFIFLGTLIQLALAPIIWSFWLVPFGISHPVVDALPNFARIPLYLALSVAGAATLLVFALASGKSGRPHLWVWAPTMGLYFPLATLAVGKALWEVIRRPYFWDKTAHGGFGGASSDPAASPPSPHPA